MYPLKQMPSLMTRNDTQNFDSRMYSNICINFLRNENSTFRPKNNNKKKKKGESLKDISTYGSFDSQSSTLSRYSWILIFHRINPFSFFYPRTRASRCYYNFRPFEYPSPPKKGLARLLMLPDASYMIIMTREKKNGVMKEYSVRRAQRDLLTFIVSKRSKWRH